MTRKELGEILRIKTTLEPVKRCWFVRGRDWSNYTTIKGEIAHRVVYRLCIGPLINGQEICHKCDRKGCINPNHLFQGTHSSNMQDARTKKRGWHIVNKTGRMSVDKLRELDKRRRLDLELPSEYFHAHWSSVGQRLRDRAKQTE